MTSIGSPSPFFLAGKKAYAVERSLRFNSGDSAYLNRTPSSASNKTTFTLSVWVKRASNLDEFQRIFEAGANTSNRTYFTFDGDDKLEINHRDGGSEAVNLTTTARFRDVSAWYHIVLAIDTTQSTSSDRIKIYVNGTQQTAFDTSTYPSSSKELDINSTAVHYIGRTTNNTSKFDGYMAEINFVDGSALTPSSFGETDATTGQWNPKKYVGSYGTNGFYLNFSDNSGTTATTLGKDSSGNGNNFTPNNFAVSDALKDSPTLNFCTMNSVAKSSNVTLSQGNLGFSCAATNKAASSTFGVSSGKWYWEVRSTDSINGGSSIIGIVDNTFTNENFFASNSDGYGYAATALKYNNSSNSSYGATWTNGDIIGVALDLDAGTLTFYKNNSSQGAAYSSISGTFSPVFSGQNGTTYVVNFGQDSTFAGAISSGGNTDANGKGDFKYAPPTGHKALCSANLPNPVINFPDKHFDTVLYTGDGNATGSQTNVLEFQPDWLWTKSRNASYVHLLYDAVRGAGDSKALNLAGGTSPGTGAEGAAADNATYGYLNSFDANGFSYTRGSATTTYFNQSGINYAVWNWNGGNTDGKTYTVKVHDFSGNNRYIFDDFQTEAVTLDLAEGGTYIFNMDDASNASHPFMIGTTANDNTTAFGSGIVYKLDGVVKTFAQYHAGFAAATTRRLEFTIPASTNNLFYFCYSHSGMGGQINTNSTLGSSNFDGSVQSTVKANPTAGFSIVRYPGGQSSPYTIGHGLGVAPKIIITKSITNVVNWGVYFNILGVNTNWLSLNTSASLGLNGNSEMGGAYAVLNASTVQMDNAAFGGTGTSLIMYAFSEVAGYSKFGKYTGNGSTDGTFVFTGFRPAVIILKRTNTAASWVIHDNKRAGYNGDNDYLHPDLLQAESDGSTGTLDILSNGFKLRMTAGTHNGSGDTFIYLAFAESPFKYARAR